MMKMIKEAVKSMLEGGFIMGRSGNWGGSVELPKQNSKPIPNRIDMSKAVFDRIEETIGTYRAETGAILGAAGDCVDTFYFDKAPNGRSGASYTPNHSAINRVLSEDWSKREVVYMGAVHSHPIGIDRPSGGDHVYAQRLLDHLKQFDVSKPYFYIPIVYSKADTSDGKFRMYSYIACYRGNKFCVEPITLYVGGKEYKPEPMPMRRYIDDWRRPEPDRVIVRGTGSISSGGIVIRVEAPVAVKTAVTQPASGSSGSTVKQTPAVKTEVANTATTASTVKQENIAAKPPEKTLLKKIEMTKPPKKTEYAVNEQLETDGIEVVATYSDGTTNVVTRDCRYEGFDSSKNMRHTVKVLYEEDGLLQTTQFSVAPPFPMHGMNSKTVVCLCNGSTEDFLKRLALNGFEKFVLLKESYAVANDCLGKYKTAIQSVKPDAVVVCESYSYSVQSADAFLEKASDQCKSVFKGIFSWNVIFVDTKGKQSRDDWFLELAQTYGAPFVKLDTWNASGDVEMVFKYPSKEKPLEKCVVVNGSSTVRSVMENLRHRMLFTVLFQTANDSPMDGSVREYRIYGPSGRLHYFRFKYRRRGSIWRAYILNRPKYKPWPKDWHSTHRLDDGKKYVCWTPEPTSYSDIVAVSEKWARTTARYVETGVFAE
jgi:bacterioferritin-associated ferredoxin